MRLPALCLPILFFLPVLASGASAQLIGHDPPAGQSWPDVASPTGNPFVPSSTDPFMPTPGTDTDLRRVLGKLLFWDEQVSADNTMACGSCHFPSTGGIGNGESFPSPAGKKGVHGMVPQDILGNYIEDPTAQEGRRVTDLNPPSMIGSGFFRQLFWDTRAGPGFVLEDGSNTGFQDFAALEALATEPPVSPVEMGHDDIVWDDVVEKLGPSIPLALATNIPQDIIAHTTGSTDYDSLFDTVFATHPTASLAGIQGATRDRFALAVATYLRTLVPNQAPIDVLPPSQLGSDVLNGMQHLLNASGSLDSTVIGCFGCHSKATPVAAPQLSATGGFVDPFDSLLSTGTKRRVATLAANPGSNVKVPSLRNVALRKNFFHDGSGDSLEQLISFYNRELVAQPTVFFDPALSTTGKAEVLAFFQALTDPRVAQELPPFDRPQLYIDRVPYQENEEEAGTPAQPGGTVPEILANAPLLDGQPHFKSGVYQGPALGTGFVFYSLAKAPGPVILINTNQVVLSAVVGLDAQGFGTHVLGALNPGLVGLTLYSQWALHDSTSGALSYSNRAEFVMQ